MIVVKSNGRAGEQILCTCFFPDYVCGWNAKMRGKKLARALVLEFCDQLPNKVYLHPERSKAFLKKKAKCLRDQVQFVTLQSWGFECEGQPSGTGVDWLSEGERPVVQPRLVNRTHNVNSEQVNVCR